MLVAYNRSISWSVYFFAEHGSRIDSLLLLFCVTFDLFMDLAIFIFIDQSQQVYFSQFWVDDVIEIEWAIDC